MYTQQSIQCIFRSRMNDLPSAWVRVVAAAQNYSKFDYLVHPLPASSYPILVGASLLSKIKIMLEYKIVDKRVRRMMTDQMNLILVFDRFEKQV